MDYTITLDLCGDHTPEVGGKAAGLARLIGHGFEVPAGFVVTTHAYRAAVKAAALDAEIAALLADVHHTRDNTGTATQIQALFADLVLPAEVAEAIADSYASIGGDAVDVAVRSSATAEDLSDASFAGQQDTYLHVREIEAVYSHVIRCWASLFTPQVLSYRSRFGADLPDPAMAVVVQTMIPADAAGVMMTIDPVTGDRSRLVIEAARGLGEGVVRGDVATDHFAVDKSSLEVVTARLGKQKQAHRYVEATGTVELVDLDDTADDSASLTDDEIRALAFNGVAIERAFGTPMDIEWAVAAPDGGERRLYLLQARPETVWSNKPAPARKAPAEPDEWDPLHCHSEPHEYWTRTNLAEAMPGVLTPLTWTFWGPNSENASRGMIADIGALTKAEARVPADLNEWTVRIFFGRVAWSVDYFVTMGDRMPGTTAAEAAASVLGRMPDDIESNPTRRFYPAIAWRMPRAMVTTYRDTKNVTAETEKWYRNTISRVADMDLIAAQRALDEASARFRKILLVQGRSAFVLVQPIFQALAKIVERAGTGDVGTLSGSGGAELAMLDDMWRASRGTLSTPELLLRHGFHGPDEGELSSRPWRENDAPLRHILAEYAARDDADSPTARDRVAQQKYQRSVPGVLAAFPPWQRPAVATLLRIARAVIPQRGIAKRGMLESVDVARAAARRIGALHAQAGLLDDPEDVFYLTRTEAGGTLPSDVRDLVVKRRARREEYLGLTLPAEWRGMPVPIDKAALVAQTAASVDGQEAVSGMGVSAGVVEARARVLTSAEFETAKPGEILVTQSTDPSWASVMFTSAGLVVDIGSLLSHAAVVAREIGLPCVVNTQVGTSVIRTGDLIRVDGATGIVQIVERAAARNESAT
jgi:rifampicin phosphotransferase